ncbi:MAG: DUF3501 family protein [Pseudomonadota bacterium]
MSERTARLAADDLLTLEDYARNRKEFRARVLAHKRDRQQPLGDNSTLYFEDRLTIQYQVQEMLRIERLFEPDAIAEELAAYNPLIPDGANWKATFMLEFPDESERREQLRRLHGIEHTVWVGVAGHARVKAIANEDIERSDDEKTSAVHFMRFELDPAMIAALRSGAELMVGIDHDVYWAEVNVNESVRRSLLADLD